MENDFVFRCIDVSVGTQCLFGGVVDGYFLKWGRMCLLSVDTRVVVLSYLV